jgi:predicted DNA-binding transcriptional regulator AlpA
MDRLTLTARELWEALGISRSRFYELKDQGIFKHLESPVPHRYSKAKVEAWVAGTSVHGSWAKAS